MLERQGEILLDESDVTDHHDVVQVIEAPGKEPPEPKVPKKTFFHQNWNWMT